jgi:hypothetical protein
VKESSELLPQPLVGLIAMIKEIIEDLTVHYNSAKVKEVTKVRGKKRKKG